jgi:hypothetical protein
LFFALIDLDDAAVVGFVVFLAIAAWLVWGSATRRLEDRFLDSRALAEGLRVLGFWRGVGISRNVSDGYLAKHLAAVDWIRVALVLVETETGPALPQPRMR